jgi:hypothetical protein
MVTMGDGDDRYIFIRLGRADASGRLEAVDIGEVDVHDDEQGALADGELHPADSRLSCDYLVAVPLQGIGDETEVVPVILDYQYLLHRFSPVSGL